MNNLKRLYQSKHRMRIGSVHTEQDFVMKSTTITLNTKIRYRREISMELKNQATAHKITIVADENNLKTTAIFSGNTKQSTKNIRITKHYRIKEVKIAQSRSHARTHGDQLKHERTPRSLKTKIDNISERIRAGSRVREVFIYVT